jgi:predicted permease
MTPLLTRLLQSIVAGLASADERRELLVDLQDEARRRAVDHGDNAAARWHRRQLIGSIPPLLARRVSVSRLLLTSGAIRDLRLACRSLAAAPAFTISVVALLSLAIGSHTVVYAVVDGLLLRPLPFGDRGERLFTLHSVHPALSHDWDDAGVSYLDMTDLRREGGALEAIEGVINRNVSVSTGTDTQRVLAASVTPGFFSMLGVAPAMGRDFADADGEAPGFEQSVILGHALWQSLTAADPGAIGREILINGRRIPIVGVMPPGFLFPDGNQLWLPYRAEPTVRRSQRSLLAVGLLRSNTSIEAGAAQLRAAAARLAARHPDTNQDWTIHVMPLRQFFTSGGDQARLLAAVSLLLIGACANVVGLILSRGLARRHELTLRAALGAGRARLVRLLSIENALLAAAGGVFGLLLASWGVHAFLAWTPEPPPYWAAPAVDSRVVLVSIAVTVAVMLAAGVLPALRLARVDAVGVLPGPRATGAPPGVRRLQHALVVAQVAASFALLAGAVLMGRSAAALLDADGGFDRDRLLSLRVYLPGDQYDPIHARAAAVDDLVRAVAGVPGVRAAAATGAIPTDDGGGEIRLRAPAGGPVEELGAQLIPVTPSFWNTLGLSLHDGRSFTGS